MPTRQGGVVAARGFFAATAAAGIKPGSTRTDMALVVSDRPAVAAAVFTTNRVQAAPVQWSRSVVESRARVRAVVLNSGNANACTGLSGWRTAERTARGAARALGCEPGAVLVASTGVIGVPLPADKLLGGVAAMPSRLSHAAHAGHAAARAIMTTDTVPKERAIAVRAGRSTYVVGGMAKGAGMIHPQMATLLGVLTTDAPLSRPQARRLLRQAVEATFNTLTVDGDTSTNDCVFLLCNGAAGGRVVPGGRVERAVAAALHQVCRSLAEAIAADGEGAKKLLVVQVSGASNNTEARQVARTIASSMLVKTAVHGGDPNWGRVLAAAGRAGVALDPLALALAIGGHWVARRGAAYPQGERAAARHLRGRKVQLHLRLGRGTGAATALGSDLSADYVRINAHYRS